MNLRNALRVTCVFALLCGCSGNAQGGAVTAKDLLHKEFALQTVNGTAFVAKDNTPTIAFLTDMQVVGSVCNRFFGKGTLKDDVLRVDPMGASMMMCPEENLTQLEMKFFKMMAAGVTVRLEDDQLTLEQGGTTLLYKFKGTPKE
ncbi:META domain-containing protein [Desulfovibrio cuneatus]|uniref:META domain-containing protein n=1 Tax=Desulfovibrio cuneatus TaxID=159728 RepID=UPI000412C86E|nr:META domain-containing protein [Desulfovibrio cuneatus]